MYCRHKIRSNVITAKKAYERVCLFGISRLKNYYIPEVTEDKVKEQNEELFTSTENLVE